jgi:hypothetical protein
MSISVFQLNSSERQLIFSATEVLMLLGSNQASLLFATKQPIRSTNYFHQQIVQPPVIINVEIIIVLTILKQ